MRIIIIIILLLSFQNKLIFAESIKKTGRVTGLDIPRFVSIKKSKTFLRRGPDKSYKIDWILEQNGYPLKVIAEHNHWRQVVDFQGDIGWVYFRLLSGKRTIIVAEDKTLLRKSTKEDSRPIAVLNYGLVGEYLKKNGDKCNAKFQNFKGWIDIDQVWGC